MSVLYIVILIGVLVFVHELGHYVFAKLFKVRVLSFSIGFGPKMVGFHRWDTEWVIRWLPLGGYVQMLGHDPLDDVPQSERERALNFKPLWQRSLVALGGPLFNLLLPIPILFVVILTSYSQDFPPVVGQVLDATPADGVLELNDEIVAVNGEPVRYWQEFKEIIVDSPGEPLDLTVLRDGEEIEVTITPEASMLRDHMDVLSQEVGRIGVSLSQYAPIVGVGDPSSPAALAGLRTFDEVVSVNGVQVRTYTAFEDQLAKAEGAEAELVILREDPRQVPYGQLGVLQPQKLKLPLGEASPGIESAAMFVYQVTPGSPADKAGIQRGDRVKELDDRPYSLFSSLTHAMGQEWEDPHILTVERAGEEMELEIVLERVTVIGEFKEERPVVLAGFYNLQQRVEPEMRQVAMGDRIHFAASQSISKTAEASTMIVVFLVRMAEGKVSTKSLGGPIMIGAMASKAQELGLLYFFNLMATISINLAIFNLLPIPVLDGGSLVLYAMEGIKGGPLSMRTRQIASFIGLAIVIFLMLFAFKNDFERYWSSIFG